MNKLGCPGNSALFVFEAPLLRLPIQRLNVQHVAADADEEPVRLKSDTPFPALKPGLQPTAQF